jgi:hypothetical protein
LEKAKLSSHALAAHCLRASSAVVPTAPATVGSLPSEVVAAAKESKWIACPTGNVEKKWSPIRSGDWS